MLDHKEMKEKLVKENLISPYDYSRAVDKTGWTDLYFNPASRLANENSNYVLPSSFLKKEFEDARILLLPNLVDFLAELKERFTGKSSIDTERNRIHGYFIDEHRMRVGNIKDGPFIVEFKEASLKDLILKKSYGPFRRDHPGLEWYLIELGRTLGFEVKIARNNKSDKNDKGEPFKEYATVTINDLALTDLIHLKSREQIDLIDVLWIDKITKKIFSAFEVEIGRKFKLAITRLAELKHNYEGYFYPIIIVKDEAARKNLYDITFLEGIRSNFRPEEIRTLTVNDLISVLTLIKEDVYQQGCADLYQYFFSKLQSFPITVLN